MKFTEYFLLVILSLLVLIACGDDSATEKIVEVSHTGLEVVSDISTLPKCEKGNDGEMVWVKNEMTPRKCSDGKWYAVAEGNVAVTCSTEPLSDGSGSKILCGGDSIGVVYNGRDGKDGEQGEKGETGPKGDDGRSGNGGTAINGKDGANGRDGQDGAPGVDGKNGKDGASCSMEKIDEWFVRVICGNDSTTLYVGKAPDTTTQGEVELDSEKIAISLDEVSGVTQKGPFLNGSKVLVREMSDGRTLTQTGNSFNGKILNDRGEFNINARMLVSQYVMLEATGYYRNEVTGGNSNSELTLFAITDVNDRNIVNVNLLTHLEYERVIYLVTQKKMKVRAAKKQAQMEVFALLNIDATNFSNSEDLNLAGSSDEDGALLAFSAVLQGDRSVAELSELLTKIATDMEKDGSWDDSTTRNKIADWAAEADSAGRFTNIRENVKNWGISAMVPDFEKYIRHFWMAQYGLGVCSEDSLNIVKQASKGKHAFYSRTRFVCKADSLNNYRWMFAGDFEKDTFGWKDSTDGVLKEGDVTGKYYIFDSTGSNGSKGWRLADRTEQQYGGCNKGNYGKVVGDRWYGGYFQCQEATHRWESIDNEYLLIETSLWTETDDGFSRWGEVFNDPRTCYVYDTSAAYKGWRVGNDEDCSLGLLGCTKGRLGQRHKTTDGAYYTCINDNDNRGYWSQESNNIVINTDGWACLDSNDGEVRKGTQSDAYFVCEDYAWRDATTAEERGCRADGICQLHNCTEGKKGKFEEQDGVLLVCDEYRASWGGVEGWLWRKANCAEIKTGNLCTANDNAVVWDCEDMGNFKVDYICSENSWHAVQLPIEYTLVDWEKKKAKYYTEEMHPDAEYGEDLVDARDSNVYKTVVIGGKRWMAENLRYADSVATPNLKSEGWKSHITCDPDRIGIQDCGIMGRFYSWSAAMNLDPKWNSDTVGAIISLPHRGICPEGWHIPDTTEWKALVQVADYSSIQMKGFDGWADATDGTGFSALPLYDSYNENISQKKVNWWSVIDFNGRYDSYAYVPTGDYWERRIWGTASKKESKLPIRCIQDDP